MGIFLDRLPRITMRHFSKLIKTADAENSTYYLKDVEVGGLRFSARYIPDSATLTLIWTEYGETRFCDVQIVHEHSNLNSEHKVRYFLCSLTKKKSRVLYKAGKFLCSGKALNGLYHSQRLSHRQRQLNTGSYPYRKYGKKYYRGNITPYGLRCGKYEDRELSALAVIGEYINQPQPAKKKTIKPKL